MSKRKIEVGNGKRRSGTSDDEDGYSTSSSYAPSAIDVSFNYVAPVEIDFMALKRLIQQLYHTHSIDVDLGCLADYIIQAGNVEKLGEGALGTVVKVEDDEDGDPFAFVSSLHVSKDGGSASQALYCYYDKVCTAASTSNADARAIKSLLDNSNGTHSVLQIFHERMINLPPQIMPPLYRMLFEEIRTNEQLRSSSYLLFFSRVFSIDALSDEDGEEDEVAAPSRARRQKSKKSKKSTPLQNKAITKVSSAKVGAADEANEMGLFHPEDAILAKYAIHTFTFAFPAVKDSDDSFNAPMYGKIVLLKNDPKQLDLILHEMNEAFALPA